MQWSSYNPRKKLKKGDREYEKIRNSITEFGYVEPVIVNSDMTIVAGHQRVSHIAAHPFCLAVVADDVAGKPKSLRYGTVAHAV